jgi:DNA-binding SARP family transcriptional activator
LSIWSVQLLGCPRLTAPDGDVVAAPASAFALIGFLSARRGGQASRGVIAGHLWADQDEEHAKHALATCLWRLKSAGGKGAPPLIEASGDMLSLSEGISVDVITFEQHLVEAQRDGRDSRAHLSAAAAAYGGDFLEGHGADWACLERERLACLHIDALVELAQAEAACGRWAAVADHARRASFAEPLREDAHRLVMEACLHQGNRGLALKQYRQCADILSRELDVEPMPETQALAARISTCCTARETAGAGEMPAAPLVAPLAGSTASLQSAIAESRANLIAAVQAFDRMIELI